MIVTLKPAILAIAAVLTTPVYASQAVLDTLGKDIDAAVAGSVEVPSVVVAIRAPTRRIDWSHASGVRAFNDTPAEATDEFRIASITKTYVAAAFLRLVEDGKLKTDQPILSLIDPELAKTLISGGYDPAKITVRHLLTHRSGIRNYADAPSYAETIGGNPTKQWTAFEQIALAVKQGKPIAAPGQRGDYSDTNYVVLGHIIERSTRKPLGEAVRFLVGFAKLGLNHTYWEKSEAGELADVPENRLHAYQDGADTAALNPSIDLYGGGGLVSTTADLISFYKALFEGRVFRNRATLAAMLVVPVGPGSLEGEGYALGIDRVGITEPVVCWGHPGHWSATAAWCPTAKIGFAVSLNGAGADAEAREAKVLAALSKAIVTLSDKTQHQGRPGE